VRVNFFRIFLFVTGLSTVAAAAARDQPGFDPANSSSLQGIPVEIVLYTDHLRVQTPFVPSVFDDGLLGRTDVIPGYKTRPTPYTEGPLAQLWRGNLAKAFSKPAVEVLDAAHCDLPVNDDLLKAVESAIRPVPWAATSSIRGHIMADGQKLEDVVPGNDARYVIALTYSLSPDLSYVIISGDAHAYSAAIPDAPSRWQSKPAWTDKFVIVSDKLPYPDKTSTDIDRMVAAEEARFAATEAPALILQANKTDDYDIRKKVSPMVAEHMDRMREAKMKGWVATDAAAERARLWTANSCSPLKDALHADIADLHTLFASLFSGQLPNPGDASNTYLPDLINDPGPAGERQMMSWKGHFYMLRRSGEQVALLYRYSFYPESPSKPKAAK